MAILRKLFAISNFGVIGVFLLCLGGWGMGVGVIEAEELEGAAVVPAGISEAEYQILQSEKRLLDSDRVSIEADIATLNANCSQVSSDDPDKVEACRLRYNLVIQRIERYNESLQNYQQQIQRAQAAQRASGEIFVDSNVVDLRDAPTQTVNLEVVDGGFTKAAELLVQKRKEQAEREKREASWGHSFDPETRLINPLWIEEITATFDQDDLALEAALADPRMKDITQRSMAFENEKRQVDLDFFSTHAMIKEELKKQYPDMLDQGLDLKALEDPRMTVVTRRSMEFEKTAQQRQAELDKEFYATLEAAKKDIAEKKAEQILRERWRKEKQGK